MIIHAQMAREDQLDRMQALGVIPSFFVLHTYYWGDRHRDIFMGPERAARIIRRGLERNRALITFPWQLTFGIWLGNWLPPRISDIFARRFPAEIEPED